MRQIVSVLLIAILLSSAIPGCLSDLRGGVLLVVNYEQTNGTVVESYVDCLLYTSDAADEGLGVDLGGRGII